MSKLFQYKTASSSVALEMIDFQNDDYAQNVEICFNTLIQDLTINPEIYRTISKHPLIKQIVDLTEKRMGIKIQLVTNGYVAAVMPFHPNAYSPLIPKEMRGEIYTNPVFKSFLTQQYKIISETLEKKGTVDIQNCKVSGIFSEYVNPIYLNIKQLIKYKLNASEITSVFLHELGHVFSAYEYSNRIASSNQVLAQLLKDSLDKKVVNKDYLFKELKILNTKTTDQELEKIFSGENIILGSTTMKFMKEVVESQMAQLRYDENSFETLADSFSARWGYGNIITKALEKFNENALLDPKQKIKDAVIVSFISIGIIIAMLYLIWSLLFLGTSSIILTFSAGILAVAISVILVTYIIGFGTDNVPMTYDDLAIRYQRIRNQILELLKNTDLPKKQTLEIIEQIKEIDHIVSTKNNYKTILTIIIDFLNPIHKKNEDDIEYQRLLEALSANDLYLKAAELRTLV